MTSPVRLHAHPLTQRVPEIGIDATIYSESGQLELQYRVRGDISALLVPTPAESKRRDELWRHTCAELFVAAPDQPAYCEFNFSPSRAWAAYRFEDYRQGRCVEPCMPPVIDTQRTADSLLLSVQCRLPDWLDGSALQASTTMVIEDVRGGCSYWSAYHAAGQPDFHRRESFLPL